MRTGEMARLPQRVTTNVCERFFAFVCQVEWGLPPAETAHLLGYKHLRPEVHPAQQTQEHRAGEEPK